MPFTPYPVLPSTSQTPNVVDLALLVVVAVAIPALSARKGRALAAIPASERSHKRSYWTVIVRNLALDLLVVGLWISTGRPLAALGFDHPVGLGGRIGFAIAVIVGVFYTYAAVFKRRSSEQLAAAQQALQRQNVDRVLPHSGRETALFICMALIASPSEELLYRGYLFWLFTPATGLVGAVALSSAIFGIGHAYLGRVGIVRTTLIGLGFAIAYALTGSLWWLMIAHTFINLIGLAIQRRLLRAAVH